jgi:hypothetical protein
MRLACFRLVVWPAIAAGYTTVFRNPRSVSRKRIAVKYGVTLLLSCGLVFGSEKANAHAVREFHNHANELIQRALSFVPDIKAEHIVILTQRSELLGYLLAWGYSQPVTHRTVQEVGAFAEFTIDHHFPIFVNASSSHFRRILRSWELSAFPDQAARVMASDLYHEYLHAEYGTDECNALKAQFTLLTRWRELGLLVIADPYITTKEVERLHSCKGDQDDP